MKVSLGLLPSGPDPVGEEHVRTNLPVGYMEEECGKGKSAGPPPAMCEAAVAQAALLPLTSALAQICNHSTPLPL